MPGPEEKSGERGKSEDERIRTSLRGLLGGFLAAHVAGVGAAVVGGVGIENFAIETGQRNAETIAAANHGSGIENGDDEVVGNFAAADKAENAVVRVVGVDPFETVPVKIDFI